jgi:hypothetical protein
MTAAMSAYSSAVTPPRSCVNPLTGLVNFLIVMLLSFVKAVSRACVLTANTSVFALGQSRER